MCGFKQMLNIRLNFSLGVPDVKEMLICMALLPQPPGGYTLHLWDAPKTSNSLHSHQATIFASCFCKPTNKTSKNLSLIARTNYMNKYGLIYTLVPKLRGRTRCVGTPVMGALVGRSRLLHCQKLFSNSHCR